MKHDLGSEPALAEAFAEREMQAEQQINRVRGVRGIGRGRRRNQRFDAAFVAVGASLRRPP